MTFTAKETNTHGGTPTKKRLRWINGEENACSDYSFLEETVPKGRKQSWCLIGEKMNTVNTDNSLKHFLHKRKKIMGSQVARKDGQPFFHLR